MKKFMVMYHAPIDALQQTAGASKEEMEEGMKAWMVWAEKCGDKLVDLGTPLANGMKLLYQGDPESSERQVCGYSVLQAESMEEAKELLTGHPHLGWNPACEIEIHESMALPGS
jgi:imidazoleglycerol phosphate synthase glutamine amidotransferase subunit HisH